MPTEPPGILYKIVAEMLWTKMANCRCDKSGIFVSSAGSESEGKKEGWNDRAGFSE